MSPSVIARPAADGGWPKQPRRTFRLSGIRLMCQASLAFSAMVVGVKLATATLPALEVVFFRSLLGTLMVGALMLRKKISFVGKSRDKRFLIFRGISGFIALTFHFYTISVLSLGTAVMLNYTGPIFVAILAMIFLQERPGAFLISMILVAFAGVYLLVGPGLAIRPEQLGAVLMGILSAIFAAISVIFIRLIGRRESPLTTIFYFTMIATAGSLFYLPFGFEWPNWIEWFGIAIVAIGSYYGQLWLTIAFRRAPASLVSPFSYLTPFLSFFYGLFFWGEKITLATLAGAFLIILGGSLVSIVESRRGRPSVSPE